MKGLSFFKYHRFGCEPARAELLLLNPDFRESLLLNAGFLDRQCRGNPETPQDLRPLESIEAAVQVLGIRTLKLQSPPFLNFQQRVEELAQAKFFLEAERFYAPPFLSPGSSRHGLLYNAQLKGIGRNGLTTDETFGHSWGGLYFADALRSYITEALISENPQEKILRTFGLFRYTGGESFIIREMRGFRLAQIHPSFLFKEEIPVILNFLSHEYPGQELESIFENILGLYVNRFLRGHYYKSISWDNLMLDGSYVDTESLILSLRKQPAEFVDVLVSEGPTVDAKDELPKEGVYYFYDSWAHQLSLIASMYREVFSALGSSASAPAHLMISALLKDQRLRSDFAEFTNKYTAGPQSVLQGKLSLGLQRIEELPESIRHFKTIDNWPDPLGRGRIFRYSPDACSSFQQLISGTSSFFTENSRLGPEENHRLLLKLAKKFQSGDE